MRLLIVEDNQHMRKLIRSIVGELAEEIYECSDGSESLAAYSQGHPDLVLMDIEMEEMDGITATRHLLEAFPDARIVIVTKYDDEELRQGARLAGACGYVLKEDLFSLRSILSQALAADQRQHYESR